MVSKMEDQQCGAVSSTSRDVNAFKQKKKLKLNLAMPSAHPEPMVTFDQTTSTYHLKGNLQTRDETDTHSASVSKNQKRFFTNQEGTNPDYNTPIYSIRERSNGKFMEDKCIVVPSFEGIANCSFYGVYDGHSTVMIAELLKERLHSYIINYFTQQADMKQSMAQGFEQLEKEAVEKLKECKQNGGSTALCVIVKDNTIYTGNVGDCQAVVVSENKVKTLNQLHDYSNQDEERDVNRKGGVILQRGDVKRLHGELAISRSIGDPNYKEYISSLPEITEHKLEPSDEFLLLATDGFWNVIDSAGVYSTIELIKEKFPELYNVEKISEYLIQTACTKTMKAKKDNMALITVDLKKLAQQE